jgi:hypothetical protein
LKRFPPAFAGGSSVCFFVECGDVRRFFISHR